MVRHAQCWFVFRRKRVVSEIERDFRIRPGKPRNTRVPRTKGFIDQVLRAAQKAGHTSPSRTSRGPGRSTFGRGQNRFGRSRLFSPTRRVVVNGWRGDWGFRRNSATRGSRPLVCRSRFKSYNFFNSLGF